MASPSNALPLDVDSSRSRFESARRWEGIVGGGPQVSSRGPSSSLQIIIIPLFALGFQLGD